MSKPKVFLTGGDKVGWALDEDLKLTESALNGVVEFADLSVCQVVHSVWWEALLELPNGALVGKTVVCHMSGEPRRYLAIARFCHMTSVVGLWIVRTSQAARQLTGLNFPFRKIPYLVDLKTFRPLSKEDVALKIFRDEWGIPKEAYLIGNFSRDSEGANLAMPKLAKGPDLFVEIVHGLFRRGHPVHVILAGPRRHWIRNELTRRNIPYTFVGEEIEGDDMTTNLLPRKTLSVLYNLVDLYLVSSRSEGGPHAIMEASACRCKIISTPVGLAADSLNEPCIYRTPEEGMALIERDIRKGGLVETLDVHYQRVRQQSSPGAARDLFQHVYDGIDTISPCRSDTGKTVSRHDRRPRVSFPGASILTRIAPRLFSPGLVVALWHKFFKPPYGGGNQFMHALRKGLRKQGVVVHENRLAERIDAHVLNSIHFDVEQFMKFGRDHELRVVHRIDGPIHLIRGTDRDKDELCFKLNAHFAAATVIQSHWTYERILEMGYEPTNPVIIHNAVDQNIFNRRERIPFYPDRKIRLISTSWSDNPRKGGPIYKWIEEHLNWERFEYTFVGRASERFDRIRHLPPMPSRELADILRQHDIYITASQNDPCSNALLEGLACGLPALYFNDGGHPELVGHGGLPFNGTDDVLSQLDELVENYHMFQNLIVVPSLDDVTEAYLGLLRKVSL
jgi:glycosyltransferase involved in cell wall biosynthesis